MKRLFLIITKGALLSQLFFTLKVIFDPQGNLLNNFYTFAIPLFITLPGVFGLFLFPAKKMVKKNYSFKTEEEILELVSDVKLKLILPFGLWSLGFIPVFLATVMELPRGLFFSISIIFFILISIMEFVKVKSIRFFPEI